MLPGLVCGCLSGPGKHHHQHRIVARINPSIFDFQGDSACNFVIENYLQNFQIKRNKVAGRPSSQLSDAFFGKAWALPMPSSPPLSFAMLFLSHTLPQFSYGLFSQHSVLSMLYQALPAVASHHFIRGIVSNGLE